MRKLVHIQTCRAPHHGLQCGRIYKDAEIADLNVTEAKRILLQCGRIYKDAEMHDGGFGFTETGYSFNVAASIKMRK